jgi:prepilin-type N-terminal cleavage/methylation domain-containing protein
MRRRGFTLIEVVVALGVLAGAIVAIAHVTLVAGRAADGSRDTTLATLLAVEKIEQLRSLSHGLAPDGTAVDDFQSDVSESPPAPTGGPGLAASPPGTLTTDTAGYVDYLDAEGRWVAGGNAPPGRAVFARRWSIEAAPASAPSTLMLRVSVARRPPAWSLVALGTPPWAVLVVLEAAKTRRAG